MNKIVDIKINYNTKKAIIFMILACVCFAFNNVLIKLLTLEVKPLAMVFYKNLTSVIILMPIAVYLRANPFDRKQFNKMNFGRSLLDLLSVATWFIAIANVDISQAVALSFLTPIFISILAIFILKEKVTADKWLGLTIGFVGALLILHPDIHAGVNNYLLLVIATALMWALSAILFKKLTFIQQSFSIIFYLKIIKTLMSIPLIIYEFQMLNAQQWLYLFILSLCNNAALYMVALSYKYEKISTVIPFDFMRLVFTSLLAFFIFGEVLAINAWFGAGLIILASATMIKYKSKKRS